MGLTDANASLGSFSQYNQNNDLLIGAHGHFSENTAGATFRRFLKQHNLAALNTICPDAVRPTYFGSFGNSSRIDFIFSTPAAVLTTRKLWVQTRLGYLLQLANVSFQLDHVPISWQFPHPCPLHEGETCIICQEIR